MKWDNRIVKHQKSEYHTWYAIHEVFYDNDGQVQSYSEEPLKIIGEDIHEVKSQLKRIVEDIEKDVLDASTVNIRESRKKTINSYGST